METCSVKFCQAWSTKKIVDKPAITVRIPGFIWQENTRFRCNQSSTMKHRLSNSFEMHVPSPGGLWSLWSVLMFMAGCFSEVSISRNVSDTTAGHPFAPRPIPFLPTAQAIGLSGFSVQTGLPDNYSTRFCLSDWLWPFIRGRDGPEPTIYPLRL